jgi:hypothetical protein
MTASLLTDYAKDVFGYPFRQVYTVVYRVSMAMLTFYILVAVTFTLLGAIGPIENDNMGYQTCLWVVKFLFRLFAYCITFVYQVYKKLAIENGTVWGKGATANDCYRDGWVSYMSNNLNILVHNEDPTKCYLNAFCPYDQESPADMFMHHFVHQDPCLIA